MKPRSMTTACLTRTAFTLAFLTGLGATAMPAFAQPTGGCCRPDIGCSIATQSNCTVAGGFWYGANSACVFADCDAVGACCLSDGSCSFRPSAECVSAGGVFNGAGTKCANVNCIGVAGGGGGKTNSGCGACGVGLPAVLLAAPAYWAARRRRRSLRR